ncbi:MAG: hypothetical protein R3C68_01965 [Myxococcota bacterium]
MLQQYLKDSKIRILREDIGGRLPRKIYFDVRSGRTFVKWLLRFNATIRHREDAYRFALRHGWLGHPAANSYDYQAA